MMVSTSRTADEINALPDEFALLRACMARISDHRKAKGKLYALPDVLSLVVLGLMAECRSLSATMRFGRCHPEVLPVLGLRAVPSVPTLSRVLAGVDREAVRGALRQFAQALATQRGVSITVAAMDGKTLRGVHEDQGLPHLLHIFALEAPSCSTRCRSAQCEAKSPWLRPGSPK